MRILRQLLTLVLVFVLTFPAFGKSEAIGQAVYTQAASVREGNLIPGSTLLSGETVTVHDKGIARIALVGGSQIEVLDQSSVRFDRSQSAVQFSVESGSASFRSEPNSPVEALIADATIRSAPALGAVGLISMQTPESALVVATKGMLEIATLHDGQTVQVPEGSAARISLVPDPQGGAQPAGRAGRLGGVSGRKLAIIALVVGGAAVIAAVILANREAKQNNINLEVSPFKVQ